MFNVKLFDTVEYKDPSLNKEEAYNYGMQRLPENIRKKYKPKIFHTGVDDVPTVEERYILLKEDPEYFDRAHYISDKFEKFPYKYFNFFSRWKASIIETTMNKEYIEFLSNLKVRYICK
jgi:hypothetical protein